MRSGYSIDHVCKLTKIKKFLDSRGVTYSEPVHVSGDYPVTTMDYITPMGSKGQIEVSYTSGMEARPTSYTSTDARWRCHSQKQVVAEMERVWGNEK